MQEVLDLVVDSTNGRAPVQPFRSPMIKAPRYERAANSGSGSKPQETPSSEYHLASSANPMKFLQGSNKAYESN